MLLLVCLEIEVGRLNSNCFVISTVMIYVILNVKNASCASSYSSGTNRNAESGNPACPRGMRLIVGHSGTPRPPELSSAFALGPRSTFSHCARCKGLLLSLYIRICLLQRQLANDTRESLVTPARPRRSIVLRTQTEFASATQRRWAEKGSRGMSEKGIPGLGGIFNMGVCRRGGGGGGGIGVCVGACVGVWTLMD